ncbi:MAG: hypothetical protein WBF87_11080 [Mesorhizobium sp.]
MDVEQLINLSNWYVRKIKPILKSYQDLSTVLSHNASQPNKQPVREHLANLTASLEQTPLELLSSEEISHLDEIGVLKYLGPSGLAFVNETVTSGDFDPASASSDISAAIQRITELQGYFRELLTNLSNVGFVTEDAEQLAVGESLIRVRFQNDASIRDVQLLKKWSVDWYDIARGVAMCVGESPNDVKVVGASKGSIILTLAATASVTFLLAKIAKHVGAIAHEGLKVAGAVESLKQQKLHTAAIEAQLKENLKKTEEGMIESTVAEVVKSLPKPINGDTKTALVKAVEKFSSFTDKGGDVDFVVAETPEEDPDVAADDLKEIIAQTKEIQEVVNEIRAQNAEIRRLTHVNPTPGG